MAKYTKEEKQKAINLYIRHCYPVRNGENDVSGLLIVGTCKESS